MNCRQIIGCFILFLHIILTVQVKGDLKVIYAINAGSHEHTDQNGITYEADPLRVGTASDYGNHLIMIGRVSEQDEILYRTERYHTSTFGYDLPLNGDGDYALILKFCEVYFNEPNKKIFDVVLNRKHRVISQLDIYHLVGRGTAHEEYVFFRVSGGRLLYKDEESAIVDMIRLEFVKGSYDNPKINAFALLKGDVERIPRLLPLVEDLPEEQPTPGEEEYQQTRATPEVDYDPPSRTETNNEDTMDNTGSAQQRTRTLSGPRKPSPYMDDDSSSLMLPICIAVGAFIPLLFCLCKL